MTDNMSKPNYPVGIFYNISLKKRYWYANQYLLLCI